MADTTETADTQEPIDTPETADTKEPVDTSETTDTKTGSFNITRRGVLYGAIGFAAVFAVGGVGVAFAGERDLLRPPGGQDQDRLLGACIKCDRCRSACPHGVIDVAHLEDGFVNARTPKMDFEKGYCDFCSDGQGGSVTFRCVDACPTGALAFGFDPDTGQDKIGLAQIDTDECLLYRSGSGHCSKQCISACAYGAITLDENERVQVEVDNCNGCGACENACPSASYASYTGSNRRGINVEAWGDAS